MDIQVASNFERYLYYRVGGNPARLTSLMKAFAKDGRLPTDFVRTPVENLVVAGSGSTESTLATIRRYYENYQYLLDPHSAVGVFVGGQHLDRNEPMICLATAHPAKFGQAIVDATGRDAARHPAIDRLKNLPTRCAVLPASIDAVRAHMAKHMIGQDA
jgi:threonine synthase